MSTTSVNESATEVKTNIEAKKTDKKANNTNVKNTAQESVYKVSEFANNAKALFGTKPECVITALKNAGKSIATLSEAKDIVKKFLNEEVE